MPVKLDMYTLVAFLTCALAIVALIYLTGREFTVRIMILWLVASLILAPVVRRFILSLARKIHIGAIEVLYTNLT